MASDAISKLLEKSQHRSLLRISTAGSVDDGKSTFIGRLLYDCKGLYEDQIDSLKGKLRGDSFADMDLASVTDGLRAEREQGITIDVAYRYFSTPSRHFIMADTPGHEQYTRNMATGASTANLAILLIDARHGVTIQTKRHAFIASLLGIPRLLVTINKMDLVDWSEEKFLSIKEDFSDFAAKLNIKEIKFTPVSALLGDNVVEPSKNMDWYDGMPVIRYLEEVYIDSDRNMVDFRYPVQYVVRPNQDFRGFAGQIASGSIKKGEEVTILPSNKTTKIKGIHTFEGELDEAHTPKSVVLTLEDEVDVSRGDMIVRSQNRPRVESELEATVIWMSEKELEPGHTYKIKHTSKITGCRVTEIKYKLDINNLGRIKTGSLKLNDLARISFSTTEPLFADNYQRNRSTGCFIIIDEITNETLAAGTIIDRMPDSAMKSAAMTSASGRSENITLESSLVSQSLREKNQGHRAMTFWFTGLSGSGKSTLSINLEKSLHDEGYRVFRLDGDNVRHGLCGDLGFSDADRKENIRRVAEVAKLLNQAGTIVLCSFISPFIKDRATAKECIGADQFFEVFVDTPLETCEKRDPKGLYKKARAGEIKGFTGISSPYENPPEADLHIRTVDSSVDESVAILRNIVAAKTKI